MVFSHCWSTHMPLFSPLLFQLNSLSLKPKLLIGCSLLELVASSCSVAGYFWLRASFRALKETSGFTAFICLIPDSFHVFPISIIFLMYVPPRPVLGTCKILKSFAPTHTCPPPFPKSYNFSILLTWLVLLNIYIQSHLQFRCHFSQIFYKGCQKVFFLPQQRYQAFQCFPVQMSYFMNILVIYY